MQLGLLLAYPALAHLAVLRHSPALQATALFVLTLGLLLPSLGRPVAWLGLAAAAGGLAALARLDAAALALYLPPLALQGLALWAFARSLAPGRTPLVTQIAAATRGELPDEVRAYTRIVTWLWALLLGAMLATTLALQLAGWREAWSLFTNVISYALLAVLFVGEYAVRRIRFRSLPHPGLLQHLRQVLRHRPRPAGP